MYENARAFMESHLPAFKEKNPQLEVVTELIRGQHPHLKGQYSKISFVLLILSYTVHTKNWDSLLNVFALLKSWNVILWVVGHYIWRCSNHYRINFFSSMDFFPYLSLTSWFTESLYWRKKNKRICYGNPDSQHHHTFATYLLSDISYKSKNCCCETFQLFKKFVTITVV